MGRCNDICKFCINSRRGRLGYVCNFDGGDGYTTEQRTEIAKTAKECFHFAAKDDTKPIAKATTAVDVIAELNALPGLFAEVEAAKEIEAVEVEAAPASAGDIDPMARPLWEIDPDFLNPFEELPPIQCWATMGSRPAFPKEGIILIQAKPKQGKSYSTYAALIPLLTGKPFNSITPNDRPRLVLVFDMEMSRTTLTNRVFKQMQTLGEQGNRFIVCPLKAKSLNDRLTIIKNKIATYNPDVVVIDQAGQLVMDVNNQAETNTLCQELDRLSIGRTMFVIIHENKSKEDTNARGSLGSYLQFAQVESYTASKGNGVFTLTPKEARDTDTEEAEAFCYMLDEGGKIIDGSAKVNARKEAERAAWLNNFARIFGTDVELSRSEIVNRLKEQDNLRDTAADNKVKTAVELGVIIKIGTEHRAPYKIAPN